MPIAQNLQNHLKTEVIPKIAKDLEKSLRKNDIWPVDTGLSLKGFHTEAQGFDIIIGNTHRYAIFVNNGRRISRSTKANPNYQAIQKWLRRIYAN